VFGEFCQGQKKEKKELVRKSKNDYFYVNEWGGTHLISNCY
jgi:hypothetical protein